MDMHLFFALWVVTLVISVTVYVMSGSWLLALTMFIAQLVLDVWICSR